MLRFVHTITTITALWRQLLLALLCLAPLGLGAQAPAQGVRLDIDGPIGPATSDYLHRAMAQAQESGAELIVLRMDTPGGLDSAMRDIIKDILASTVPVVSYVAPNGARAASAGTYILYASHVAAMAPATNLGAATPVSIGPTPSTPKPPQAPQPEGEAEEKQPPQDNSNDGAMRRKVVNDAVAYIRGLAKMRGRNSEWAEKAVREAASLDAKAALEEGVIDLIAENEADLLAQLDGKSLNVLGVEQTLHTAGMHLRPMEPDWRSRLLAVITDPNIAYILMLIGIYGLILEFANPGTIIAGVVGAICLLLALFAFQVLPINYAGVGLILLGIALMVGEAFAPSFGALGIGGVVAFVIGSVILIDTDVPGFGIDIALIGAFALFSALLFVFVIGMLVKARRQPVVSGSEEMVGAEGTVVDINEHGATVRVHSELWRARCSSPLQEGQRIRVNRLDGLTLEVAPLAEEGNKGG